MNWLNSLQDQFPLLLVLSPAIGFISALAAIKVDRVLIRPLAVSNVICTLLILAAVVAQFAWESAEIRSIVLTARQNIAEKGESAPSMISVHSRLDRIRVDRMRRQWFSVDGLNLWPAVVLIALTSIVVWNSRSTREEPDAFLPLVLLFETASIAAMTACDVRAFLFASCTAALTMTGLISVAGGSDRRTLAGRFLLGQFSGMLLIMLGFALLVVGVPWMKIEDSQTLPVVSFNTASMIDDIQRWTSRNELAVQYQNEVFPWILLILSFGFAIQFGLFPFQSSMISIISQTPRDLGVLCLAGTLSMAGLGWWRFVMPLAPDLMAGFDQIILIPALSGAIWGAVRAFAERELKPKVAWLFFSALGISLLGCYCFSPVAMCGAWLMQQQLVLLLCGVLFLIDTSSNPSDNTGAVGPSLVPSLSTRSTILLAFVPALGLFASGSMILSELLRDNLIVLMVVLVVGLVLALTLLLMLNRHAAASFPLKPQSIEVHAEHRMFRGVLALMLLLAVAVNLFPQWMLYQCEPELNRVFRKFERVSTAFVLRDH